MAVAVTIPRILASRAAGQSPERTIIACYERIAAWDDPALFITVTPLDEARALAAAADPMLPLAGVPFAVKDNIDVAGLPTTAGCPTFAYMPDKSAFAVARLEALGAIVVGKTNLDQFATGLVGTRSPYGTPRNALRADLIPGGSSSGSAPAVAAGLVPFALGTDTAGSGRVPAALNGIVGLKPSLGLLSSTGMVPACRTLDTISVFAATIDDALIVCRAAAGFDADDAYSRALPLPYAGALPPGLRVGVPLPAQREFFGDTAAAASYEDALARLETLGAVLVPFDLAPFHAVTELLYDGPWVAERYAAMRAIIEGGPEALHPVTRAIVEAARRFSAADAFDGLYRLAALKRETARIRAGFDVMAVPTMPRAYTVAEVMAEPFALNRNLGTYTNFVNLLDLAAIAVPAGMRGDGLPGSLTLIGAAGTDGYLAGIGMALQAAAAPEPAPRRAPAGMLELAVVGAHLSGMALNHELTSLGAIFLRVVETRPDYKLFALDTLPPKPGLLRIGEGAGTSITGEVWALDPVAFGRFVAAIPSPLGIGKLNFTDGTTVSGFLVEAEAARAGRDISHHGGWRAAVAAGG